MFKNIALNPIFLGKEIIASQDALVREAFAQGFFSEKHIINLTRYIDENGEVFEEKDIILHQSLPQFYELYTLQKKTIFEWFLVENWFVPVLDQYNEPLLINKYGTWWGKSDRNQFLSQTATYPRA